MKKEQWFCADLATLFNAKADKGEDYAYCQFGVINKTYQSSYPNECYYDFGTTGMSNLCCDGEQVKVIKVEGDILTLLSDGNSYEDNPEHYYYFKLTKEEAAIAGINI